jgi:hypothetical protein
MKMDHLLSTVSKGEFTDETGGPLVGFVCVLELGKNEY